MDIQHKQPCPKSARPGPRAPTTALQRHTLCPGRLALSPEPKAQGPGRGPLEAYKLNTDEKADAQASIAPFDLSPYADCPCLPAGWVHSGQGLRLPLPPLPLLLLATYCLLPTTN